MGTLKAKIDGLWTPIVGAAQAAADLARWNSAWGQVALSGSSNQTMSTTTPTVLSGTSTLVTLVAGRRYSVRVLTSNSYASTAGETWGISPYLDGVALTTSYYSVDIGNNYLSPGVASEAVFSTTSGQHTIDVRAWRVNATGGTMQARYQFLLTDIGPVTQAAASPPAASPQVVASGNALGIVAMGAMKVFSNTAVTASTDTAITEPLNLYTHAGRRYRLQCRLRAISPSAAGYCYLRASGLGIAQNDYYRQVQAQFESLDLSIVFDGQNAVGTYQVIFNCAPGMNIYTEQVVSNFYIEDVGPSTAPAMPIPETPPPWQQSTLQNAWVGYSGGGSRTPGVQYRKLGDLVHVRFSVMSGTTATAIATLPLGFRPPTTVDFVARDNGSIAVVNIHADGALVWYGLNANNGMVAGSIQYSTTL